MSPTEILFVIIALIVGAGSGYVLRKMIAQRLHADIEQKASRVLSDAQNKAKEELLSAKDKAMGVIEGAKREERQIRNDLNNVQRRLEKRNRFRTLLNI